MDGDEVSVLRAEADKISPVRRELQLSPSSYLPCFSDSCDMKRLDAPLITGGK